MHNPHFAEDVSAEDHDDIQYTRDLTINSSKTEYVMVGTNP